MLTAKLAPPLAVYKALSCFASPPDQIAPIVLFSAPPGYLMTECLAETLHETGRGALWIRLEAHDSDPATFLLGLVHGAQQLQPGLGSHTLEKMKAQPGPLYGWPPLFASLGQEIGQDLLTPAAIVIERFHHLYDQEQVLALFKSHFLPALGPAIPIFLTSHLATARADLPAHTRVVQANDLRLAEPAGLALAGQYAPELNREVVRRALRVSGQRPGILVSLLTASAILGPVRVAKTINQANNVFQLLSILGRDCLAAENAISPQILALALQVEYLHQDLTQTIWGQPVLPDGPWLQRLANQWVRLRSLWCDTLQTTLHIPGPTRQRILQQAAGYWLQTGQPHEAIRLYLQIEEFPQAAAVLASVYEDMLNLGQWERLAQWVGRLPEDVLREWPWLAYSLGEIEAAGGRQPPARRWFVLAANWFARQHEPRGVSQSLLAESTLAAWNNDPERAQASAQLAYQIAAQARLPWLQGWAGWQLGYIANSGSRYLEASGFFQQSATALGATRFASLADEAHSLAERQWQLWQQHEYHQQALQETEAAQRLNAAHLEQLLETPGENPAIYLAERGWAQVPLMLKLSPGLFSIETPPESRQDRLRKLVQQAWGALHWPPLYRQKKPAVEVFQAEEITYLQLPWEAADMPAASMPAADMPAAEAAARQEPAGESAPPTPATLPAPDLVVKVEPKTAEDTGPEARAPVSQETPAPLHRTEPAPLAGLAVYCLGPFRVFYHNQFIDNWGSKKAHQIFKYLVTHRQYPTPKEVLMDIFWPDADPEAARRNLHQAIYVLRQAFKAELGLHCIRFENDCYLVNLEQGLWIDHEEFERHVKTGQQLERSGQVEQAVGEYGIAEGLYQDDFMVEDPYEDWPKSRREFLWQLYLLITQQLAEYYLERKEYAAAMSLSRRILARDQAQEPAHQILIRAYLGQGQRHMALRQYKSCIQTLKQELSLAPSPLTQALYQQILKAG